MILNILCIALHNYYCRLNQMNEANVGIKAHYFILSNYYDYKIIMTKS